MTDTTDKPERKRAKPHPNWLTPVMDSALSRLWEGGGILTSHQGVTTGTVRALEARGWVTVDYSTREVEKVYTRKNGTVNKRMATVAVWRARLRPQKLTGNEEDATVRECYRAAAQGTDVHRRTLVSAAGYLVDHLPEDQQQEAFLDLLATRSSDVIAAFVNKHSLDTRAAKEAQGVVLPALSDVWEITELGTGKLGGFGDGDEICRVRTTYKEHVPAAVKALTGREGDYCMRQMSIEELRGSPLWHHDFAVDGVVYRIQRDTLVATQWACIHLKTGDVVTVRDTPGNARTDATADAKQLLDLLGPPAP